MNLWLTLRTAQVTFPRALVFLVALLSSACADNAALKEQERSRYDALETKLIKQQETVERQRKSELRIAQRLSKLDAERATQTRIRKDSEPLSALSNNKKKHRKPGKDGVVQLQSPPIATQLAVGEKSDNAGTRAWTVKSIPSPVSGSALCVVASNPIKIRNGTIDTLISVLISTSHVYLRTDARFDTDAPETGYRVDSGLPIPIDQFLNELTAVVEQGYDRLLTALRSGTSLTASFAYLPQLSNAEVHRIELDLSTLDAALTKLTECTPAESTSDL